MNNIQRKMTGMRQNYKFTDTLLVNDQTYIDYLERLKRICLSMFEWVNLPSSMNARWLERTLYYNGKASLLKDKNYGFINTMCSSAGDLNIYGLPTSLGCYGFGYYSQRKLYTGLNPLYTEAQQRARDFYECILVYNNWDPIPTCATIELFALRLYESERSADVNIKGQKYPYVIATDEKQRLFVENLYSQIDGNHPVIFGDKKQLNPDVIKTINTESPFVADKLKDYQKEIWNDFFTFMGINNIMVEKKERLVTDEANSNNEVINLNLQSFLAPRQEACRQFNEKFGLTGTDKEISVRLRSDLYNIIKRELSSTKDYIKDDTETEIKKEVELNG